MKRKLASLLAVSAVAFIAVMAIRERSASSVAARQSAARQSLMPDMASAHVATGRQVSLPDGAQVEVTVTPGDDVSDASARAQAAAKLDETIQLYRTTMKYPLWSRPADASTDHLTHWNHPISVGQPFAVDAAKREIAATAGIDRTFAAPGDAISLQLAGTYVDDGTPAALEQPRAQLQWHDRASDAWIAVQDVPLQAVNGNWTGSVIPSQVTALRTPREARLVAFAQVGEFTRELPLDFAYTVAPPIVVHGIASERVADGQLEIGLDVEIASVGTVGLTATLFAADGTTAIAVYDDRYFATRAGHQVIPVKFFGKILHDRKIDGPYRLGAIHGYVYRRDVPDVLFDRPDSPALVTLAHRASEFSAASYQDPAVDARLAQYQALHDGTGNGGPSPAPPSQHP